MSRKRKHDALSLLDRRPAKRHQTSTSSATHDGGDGGVHLELLSCYYPRVLTLRTFLLARLPQSCRRRRRLVAEFHEAASENEQQGSFLDSTMVGIISESTTAIEESRGREFAAFTQSTQRSSTGSESTCQMAEIVGFVVWRLFHRSDLGTWRPHHILCHGLQKVVARRGRHDEAGELCTIPGVVVEHSNDNVRTLKKPPWDAIAALLEKDARRILTSLLLDCGLFIPLQQGRDNYYQLSGTPLSDLPELDSRKPIVQFGHRQAQAEAQPTKPLKEPRKPNEVVLVRNRILYAKPSMNAKGGIRFGMKHIHVLNRYRDLDRHDHTVHTLKHVFPRQFRLHNVWTSSVNANETTQPLPDYTLREHEIQWGNVKVPKRLRGAVTTLVGKLRRRHQRCPYVQLLRYYCPASGISDGSSGSSASTVVHATPNSQVSVFCRSVLSNLLPSDTFGKGPVGRMNRDVLLDYVDRFVCMRRAESISMHQVSQRIKVTELDWLRPPQSTAGTKLSQSDGSKRLEIFHEFLYYIFDSILIPLIRSNFYVTESGSHRNCLFYFRHDVWSRIAAPSYHQLEVTMFESLRPEAVKKVLDGRTLGTSNIRLLPKTTGTRTIINLKRRSMKTAYGRTFLGPSINNQLAPVFEALRFERSRQASRLGSAMFSVGDMHARLVEFKRRVHPSVRTTFYFVKLDITSCFDTIPQHALLSLAHTLMQEPQYRVTRHLEVKLADACWTEKRQPVRKFVAKAYPAAAQPAFSKAAAEELAAQTHRVIFNDTGNQRVWEAGRLQKLLHEHVQDNVVKIGKKHFRQRTGIPQGSVLSSLLCSFFYGAFENEQLAFLQDTSSLLMRLIDDFLLITTDEGHARRFLQVMADGNEDYGVSINSSKSLTNFMATINGTDIPRHHGSSQFPYCGMAIDTRTLEISKDRDKKDWQVRNALTVEISRKPGHLFRRRVLASLKTQLYAMLLDTSLNSGRQVAATLHQNFTESAMKMHSYISGLPSRMRPAPTLIVAVIKDLIHLAVNLVRSRLRGTTAKQPMDCISHSQMSWLAAQSFERTLARKQASYQAVLGWLRELKKACEARTKADISTMGSIVADGRTAFYSYVY